MDENEEAEASEDELAAFGLMVELARSSRLITLVGDLLLEGLDPIDHPNETGEIVVLRRMIRIVMPQLRGVGAEACWQATGLVEKIRAGIVLDFQLTARGGERLS